MTLRISGAIAVALAAAAGALCSTTATWDTTTYADFLRGRMSGLALSRDGKLTVAPKLETLLSSDQPEVWALARSATGDVYAGTGHRGRVYRIDRQGRATVAWTSDQPEVFALAADAKGAVYAGTSPDGKVYRIENGKASEFFDPKSRYIWALAFGPDGALYVATGDQGRIYRVAANGAGSVYYESGQAHVTALGFDSQGRLLAGSEPNGILYRLTGPGKAFVLYDANLPEIRGITTMPDGTVYVAALGGSVAKRAAAATGSSSTGATPVVTAPAMSITVTDSANAQAEFKSPRPEAPKTAQTTPAQAAPAASVSTAVPTVEIAGVDKSAIYKINSDNTVEQVWSSKEENAYDLAAFGSEIVFVTDVQGRLYRLNGDRKPTLVAQTGEGEATRVFDTGNGLMVATGNLGKVYRLVGERNAGGWFESPVHDANTVARWGRLSWRGASPPGTRVVFRTRAGNSARPDNTWSDWSEPLTDPRSAAIHSPNARYLQWRLEMTSANGQAPVIESVTAAYLPQNTAPAVRSITVAVQPAAVKTQTVAAAASSAYSITVTDTGDTGASTAAGTPVQTVSRGPTSQIQLVWQADDPDGDKLTYALYFRGDDESEWKLIRANLVENTFLLDTDVLADGHYLFRVVASDRAANPLGSAREAELASSPVLIDNTPPVVSVVSSRRNGPGLAIEVQAADAISPLRRCEYSLDAGPWIPLEAADGVTDSPTERFGLSLEKVAPGERVVVFRVFDSANNAGLAKVVVR